ncbi:MAG: hypothetical protein ACRDP6_08425 [Actinoallomurus sp.]
MWVNPHCRRVDLTGLQTCLLHLPAVVTDFGEGVPPVSLPATVVHYGLCADWSPKRSLSERFR